MQGIVSLLDDTHYALVERWMPHITLADGPVFKEHLPEIITFCSQQSFAWEIKINNFAFIYDHGTHQEIGLQVPFTGNFPTGGGY